MSNSDDIPADVRQFIVANIDSVPQLEALLLIWDHKSEVWTEERLARSLYVEMATARKIAGELQRRRWIKAGDGKEVFVFDDSWDQQGAFMQKLADTYRKNLVRVATLIHSNASVAVRDFARAFDFKKD